MRRRRRRRRSLVHRRSRTLNIERRARSRVALSGAPGLSVIYGFRAAGPIPGAHPLILADRWTGRDFLRDQLQRLISRRDGED